MHIVSELPVPNLEIEVASNELLFLLANLLFLSDHRSSRYVEPIVDPVLNLDANFCKQSINKLGTPLRVVSLGTKDRQKADNDFRHCRSFNFNIG